MLTLRMADVITDLKCYSVCYGGTDRHVSPLVVFKTLFMRNQPNMNPEARIVYAAKAWVKHFMLLVPSLLSRSNLNSPRANRTIPGPNYMIDHQTLFKRTVHNSKSSAH